MERDDFVLNDPLDQFLHDFGMTERQYRWIRQSFQEYLGLQDEEYASREELILIEKALKADKNISGLYDRMNNSLLPLHIFSWIKNDKRQLMWIEKRILSTINPPRHLPKKIDQRDALISLIDCTSRSDKIEWLLKTEKDWNNQQQSDAVFKWFKIESERDRCAVAWDWIMKNKSQWTFDHSPVQNHAELLVFFESTNASIDEKKLYVETIKKRWAQQKRRKDKSEHQQENFVFDKETSKNLILLSKKYKMTKSAIVKALINLETLKGGYLGSTQEKKK